MKANKDKCYLLINASENITINVDGNKIEKSNERIGEERIGVNVDYKLKKQAEK